jgi:4-amino-4-deoxy-L-arabinose transferase-like glycosyltransferase
MDANILGPKRILALVGLSTLSLFTSLGSSSRLSYHEAIGAQSAREMLERGDIWVQSLDNHPWLEKPPLGVWPIALTGWLFNGVSEAVARLPSALAAIGLAIGVATFTARRFGGRLGLLAGSIQLTSIWLISRGRLAEVDVLLACLTTWSIVTFDQLRNTCIAHTSAHTTIDAKQKPNIVPSRVIRSSKIAWLFFTLLGLTALAKGVGFGAVLVLAAVGTTLVWDRDRATVFSLLNVSAVCWALLIGLIWPLAIMARYPGAFDLWTTHVSDRLSMRSQYFAGEPTWLYALSYFWQTLPWTPIALIGVWASWKRTLQQPSGPDRLLWCWAIAPAILVSLANVRNGHYLIYALPPWSVWAALGLARVGERLQHRGFTATSLQRVMIVGMALLGLSYALGFTWLAPRLDHRGAEWAFYKQAAHRIRSDEALMLIYDWPTWDRYPYPTPFGPMPHDLAVRLFYLNRPASWRLRAESLLTNPPRMPFMVIGREHDARALTSLGRVELIVQGPRARRDRAYALYRITPDERIAARDYLRNGQADAKSADERISH